MTRAGLGDWIDYMRLYLAPWRHARSGQSNTLNWAAKNVCPQRTTACSVDETHAAMPAGGSRARTAAPFTRQQPVHRARLCVPASACHVYIYVNGVLGES
jgi:hypothetical protein